MPWLQEQREVLRALGVHWATLAQDPRPAQASVPAPPQAVPLAAADPPRPESTPERRAEPEVPARPLRPGPLPAVPQHRVEAPAARPPEPLTDAAAAQRKARIAALDWEALRADVAACEACGLCRGRQQTVFGVGSTRAGWMIVGEAPGEQEDLQGEPFVGAAGRLLDQMLAALNLTREPHGMADQPGIARAAARTPVYIANTLKCRPPGNRNPQADELAACEPYLQRQLELLQPRIILAMGRFALQSLLRSTEPVGKLRGRVHHWQGVPLIATYHPAYLLRNPLDKARSWEDLCLAAATFEAREASASART